MYIKFFVCDNLQMAKVNFEFYTENADKVFVIIFQLIGCALVAAGKGGWTCLFYFGFSFLCTLCDRIALRQPNRRMMWICKTGLFTLQTLLLFAEVLVSIFRDKKPTDLEMFYVFLFLGIGHLWTFLNKLGIYVCITMAVIILVVAYTEILLSVLHTQYVALHE